MKGLPTMKLDTLQGLVRPVVTLALVGAFILFAYFSGDAFERIKDLSIAVVSYWFGTRAGGSNSSEGQSS